MWDENERSLIQSENCEGSTLSTNEPQGVSRQQAWTLVAIHFAVGVSNTVQGVALRVYMIDNLKAAPSIQVGLGFVGLFLYSSHLLL